MPRAAASRKPSRTRPAAAARVRPRPRRGGPRPGADSAATRAAIFAAAADAFSRRGFDGVGVDDIAGAAGVNKAMIYYHFADKLALYREIVRDMLREGGARATRTAASDASPSDKLAGFIVDFVELTESRPYFPTLMIREIAEGAPHLDLETFGLIRTVFEAFGRILAEGQRAGVFRAVHPVLAYMTILGPLMFNAARERAASQPGRERLPMFAELPHAELTRHLQLVALRMLAKE